jgi:hypothetical protein
MEASPEPKNCQEGGGEARKKGEKAAFSGEKRPFVDKKGSFLGVYVDWIINRKKRYPIDTRRLTRNFHAKNGWKSIGGRGLRSQ